jgi:hypothetical protein
LVCACACARQYKDACRYELKEVLAFVGRLALRMPEKEEARCARMATIERRGRLESEARALSFSLVFFFYCNSSCSLQDYLSVSLASPLSFFSCVAYSGLVEVIVFSLLFILACSCVFWACAAVLLLYIYIYIYR